VALSFVKNWWTLNGGGGGGAAADDDDDGNILLSFCPPCTLDLLLDILYSLFACPLYSLLIFIFIFVPSLLYLLPMFSFFILY